MERERDLRWAEKLLQHYVHTSHHLGHEEVFTGFVKGAFFAFVPSLFSGEAESLRGRTNRGCGVGRGG